jgi:WD40 repeat protein
VRILEGHTDWVNAVCPVQLAGRTLLASAGYDRKVRLWDILSEHTRYEVPVQHNATALASPTAQSLVVGLSTGILAVTVGAGAEAAGLFADPSQ